MPSMSADGGPQYGYHTEVLQNQEDKERLPFANKLEIILRPKALGEHFDGDQIFLNIVDGQGQIVKVVASFVTTPEQIEAFPVIPGLIYVTDKEKREYVPTNGGDKEKSLRNPKPHAWFNFGATVVSQAIHNKTDMEKSFATFDFSYPEAQTSVPFIHVHTADPLERRLAEQLQIIAAMELAKVSTARGEYASPAFAFGEPVGVYTYYLEEVYNRVRNNPAQQPLRNFVGHELDRIKPALMQQANQQQG